MAPTAEVEDKTTRGRRFSTYLAGHPRARLGLLLVAPVSWLALVYYAALASLIVTALFTVDEFTSSVVHTFTLDNLKAVFLEPAYLRVTAVTVGVAAAVTVVCAVLAVPMAFVIAKVVSPALRGVLVALVVAPLWASYLVKVYAWQSMVQPGNGVLAWLGSPVGIDGPGTGVVAIVLTLSYLWLPYMFLPLYSGFVTLPDSQLDASSDLGATPWQTARRVVAPALYPSLIAGSVFTFSLSLGDYITAQIVGGKTQLIGNAVYQNFASNLPFAAAIAVIPIVIMALYLAAARRAGALDRL